MTKRKAAHIIHLSFKQLYKNAGKMKKDFPEEAIHDFRVAYKKLRAFLRMLMLKMTDPVVLKIPHPLKKMYATAGEVRDRQLCIKRIKRDRQAGSAVPEKIRQLRGEVRQLSAKKNILSKKEFDGIEASLIRSMPTVIPIETVTDFVELKHATIHELIDKKKYGDKDLHEIRKSLKDIIYVTAIARDFKEYPSGAPWTKEDLKKADAMAHQLGLFNDAGIALSFLQPSEIKKTGGEEGQHLWAIRRRWLAEKRKLKKEILPQLHLGNPALPART